MDEATQKSDVGADANLHKAVRDRGGSVEAWIDCHELRVAIAPRFHDKAESDRMILGGVATHGQHDIGVANVRPAIRHRPSSECGGQTGHRGAVSNSSLLFDGDDAETGAKRLHQQVIDFIGVGASTNDTDRRQRVDGTALVV